MTMMEENGIRESAERMERDEIFSKAVRAGKRTYFFDVKATKRNEFYVTVTESKKRFHDDGGYHFEKHKIFLYKEDFDKFSEGLNEVVNFINKNSENFEYQDNDNSGVILNDDFTNVDFEDLDRV